MERLESSVIPVREHHASEGIRVITTPNFQEEEGIVDAPQAVQQKTHDALTDEVFAAYENIYGATEPAPAAGKHFVRLQRPEEMERR